MKTKRTTNTIIAIMCMWWISVFLWMRCAPTEHPSWSELGMAALWTTFSVFWTWIFQVMFKEVTSFKEIISSRDREIINLERLEKVAEGRGDRMVSLLRERFVSKISEYHSRCDGMGCWKFEEYGTCNHGYYKKERTVLKVRTLKGEIILAPDKEDIIFNHINGIADVIGVEKSFQVLEHYEYEGDFEASPE